MDVLTSTIQSLNDSAMGEDLVHNKMLRALPPTFLVPLLYLFNRCWESGSVPSAWKSSILVPIYKGKGDRSDPASYRPIALTSCIAKLYEKMIKLRFEPLIDNSLIAEQAGFWKGRSTLDNLIQLDHDIKKAFTRKRVVSAVFFDIKKAYDTLDPFAILRQAHKFNVGNNFWKWCRAFVADPPTTTLQRLKSMTTGTLPRFIEAALNFGGSEITEDNIIDQFLRQKSSVVQMGDDTWDSIFPERFLRSYPYPSFDMWDLDTVDRGFERQIFHKLKKKDWKLLIVHCLGVDHAGHRLVMENLPPNSLLLVFGDHGMTSTGEHGGDTNNEVNAALFAHSNSHPFTNDTNREIPQV
ncbi:hypothetical protein QYM36_001990 [Artemia franciscana]|uniref:Reverse transcriptase domain-containing protein n=1 Tax=Artemia franciscana TaxID=6661 RepID=A0AA88LGH0_ARTSF|nr:hypothetical protein QYM36_001990 [Artemia franciscana]